MRKFAVNLLQWLDRNYSRLTKVVASFAGILALLTMVILLFDMTTRNLGNVSSWPNETSLILVMWMFLLPVAFTQMTGGMLRITFIADKLPRKVQPWLVLLCSLAAVIFALVFLRASLSYLAMVKPGSFYPITHFPTVLQRGLIAGCAALLSLATIVCFGRDIFNLYRRSPREELSQIESE